jgi:type II secretory pathway pseudopilin PulG
MKLRVSCRTSSGLTLVEALVAVSIVILLGLVLIPGSPSWREKQKARHINCLNNLKQLGMAYRIWSGDHGGLPMDISITNGGTMELVSGSEAWRTYQVMSNELNTTKILYCPADEDRRWATNFSTDLKSNISYFIGVDATPSLPQSFLSGDDNLAVSAQPVHAGFISLATNSPVSWTKSRHDSRGNVGLADESVLVLNNSGLFTQLQQTGLATNRLAIP